MDAVVFDLDGVIVRSMEAHAAAYRAVLAPLGVAVTDRDVFLREGARSETILRDLLEGAGKDPGSVDIAAFAEKKQAVFAAAGRPGVYAGAGALLEAVWAAGVPTAVVTGTRRVNLEALIPDWVPRFDALLTQESYTHDKPHPEPYARAAEALGVPAAGCLCVENAIRGVESARAAGYGTVWAVTTTLSAADLEATEADRVFTDHAGLTRALTDVLSIGRHGQS